MEKKRRGGNVSCCRLSGAPHQEYATSDSLTFAKEDGQVAVNIRSCPQPDEVKKQYEE